MAETTVVTKENLFELTKLLVEQGLGYKVLDDCRIQDPDGQIVSIRGVGDAQYTILVRKERVLIPTNSYVYLTPFKDNSARDKAREWFFTLMRIRPGIIIERLLKKIFEKAIDGTATEPNTVTVVSSITPLLTEAIKKELTRIDLKARDVCEILYNNSTKTATLSSNILDDKECSKKHGVHDEFESPMHDKYPEVSHKTWAVIKKAILAILDTENDLSEWAENATVANCQMASAILMLSWKTMDQISGLTKELLNEDLNTVREGELLKDMESYANIERYLSVTPLSPGVKEEEAAKPNPASSYVVPGSNQPIPQVQAPAPVVAAAPVVGYGAPGQPSYVPQESSFAPAGSLAAPPTTQKQMNTRIMAFSQQPTAPVGYGQPMGGYPQPVGYAPTVPGSYVPQNGGGFY